MLVTMFKDLKLHLPVSDSLKDELVDVNDIDILSWTNIEESEDVRESVVDDLLEDMEIEMPTVGSSADIPYLVAHTCEQI